MAVESTGAIVQGIGMFGTAQRRMSALRHDVFAVVLAVPTALTNSRSEWVFDGIAGVEYTLRTAEPRRVWQYAVERNAGGDWGATE
jgi:hypothetical protein